MAVLAERENKKVSLTAREQGKQKVRLRARERYLRAVAELSRGCRWKMVSPARSCGEEQADLRCVWVEVGEYVEEQTELRGAERGETKEKTGRRSETCVWELKLRRY